MRVLNKSFSIGLFGAAFADSNLFITKRGRVSARPNRPTQGNHTRLGRKPRRTPSRDALLRGNITETSEQTHNHQLSILAEQLKELIKKEVSQQKCPKIVLFRVGARRNQRPHHQTTRATVSKSGLLPLISIITNMVLSARDLSQT